MNKFNTFMKTAWFKIAIIFLLLIAIVGAITGAAYAGKTNTTLSKDNDAKITLGNYGQVRKSDIKNLSNVNFWRTDAILNKTQTGTMNNDGVKNYNYYYTIAYFFTINFKVGDTYFTYFDTDYWNNQGQSTTDISSLISTDQAISLADKQANLEYTQELDFRNVTFNTKIENSTSIDNSEIIAKRKSFSFDEYVLYAFKNMNVYQKNDEVHAIDTF